MAKEPLDTVLHYIRQLAGTPAAQACTDRQLLGSFAANGDEAAFARLVQRHGPMVWGVCRRVLQQVQDAEDAFQATFLVLARKAGRVRWQADVGNWLYAVAFRTTLKAKTTVARQHRQERQIRDMPATEPTEETSQLDLRPVLDEELNRLPWKYRAPVVLHYLEGNTYAQAAQVLGLPAGTVAVRLARARQMLRKRLTQRGITLSTGLFVGLVSHNEAPAALFEATVKAATVFAAGQAGVASLISAKVLTLTEGVLQAMFITKLKIAAAFVVAVCLVGAGAGVLGLRTMPAVQADGSPIVGLEKLKKASKASPFTATLTKAVTVELVGVARNNDQLLKRAKTWWKPDGTPLPTAPYSFPCTYSNEDNPYEFAFRLSNSNGEGLSFRAEGPAGKNTGEAQVPQDERRKALPSLRAVVIARFAAEDIKASVRVVVASGPWTKVEVWQDYPWEKLQGSAMTSAARIVFSWPREEENGAVAEITHTYLNEATRLVAFDRQGKLHESAEQSGGTGKGITRRHCIFSGLKLKDIQRFEFQRRPYLLSVVDDRYSPSSPSMFHSSKLTQAAAASTNTPMPQ